MTGRCLEGGWRLSGGCLGGVWKLKLPWGCLLDIYQSPGGCLVPRRCLIGVSKVSERFLVSGRFLNNKNYLNQHFFLDLQFSYQNEPKSIQTKHVVLFSVWCMGKETRGLLGDFDWLKLNSIVWLIGTSNWCLGWQLATTLVSTINIIIIPQFFLCRHLFS